MMQTVPSLVGTGTAIAAAASGLVFGQPAGTSPRIDHDNPTVARSRARGHTRTVSIDPALLTPSASSSTRSNPPPRRPATSSAATRSIASELHAVAGPARQTTRPPPSRRQRPQHLQATPSTVSSRRLSLIEDHWYSPPSATIREDSKESLTSTRSWFRRLSLRPLSQHGSSVSSIWADSTSFTISHGSAAPILSPSASLPKPPSPNKLVKRSFPNPKQAWDRSGRKSKGHLPSLRRPATSHQRSATLQQFRTDIDLAGPSPHPKYSFDEPIRPEELLGASPIEEIGQSPRIRRATSRLWASFFHTKTGEIESRTNSQRRLRGHGDAVFRGSATTSRRIQPGNCSSRGAGPHLVKPRMVSASSSTASRSPVSHLAEADAGRKGRRPNDAKDTEGGDPSHCDAAAQEAPPARSRHSFSCSFSHSANWTSRAMAPGSSRRTKCSGDASHERDSDHQRHVSEPGTTLSMQSDVGLAQDGTIKPPVDLVRPIDHALALDPAADLPGLTPRRSPSSPPQPPPPPVLRLPALHVYSSRSMSPATSGGSSICPTRRSQPSGSSTSSSSAAVSQRRSSHHEKLFALDSVDVDVRDMNSADEDDTDFRSDVLFDSIRTTGSGRTRAVETPLESVYDESPPSTGGNKKSKRSSIQEMLDFAWNDNGRIMEEDEASPSPAWAAQRPAHHAQQLSRERGEDPPRGSLDSPPPRYARQITYDVARRSQDDDFDEDWTRDDDDARLDAPSPSSNSTLFHPNAAANINPNVRLALASIGANTTTWSKPGLARAERPSGNLFDWSEPPAHDKQNAAGDALRPQTAYGKQYGHSRGGRSAVRKRPVPTHVRSQSVPVVHETAEDLKLMGSKYSTWGLGTKTVSEDWDEDFEFGGDNHGLGGTEKRDLFAVPESIRASQPSVKAHSGQIREFSLLVNDLKRLCRHGRELNMLNGDHKPLWKEAEGIIALASPDEDHVLDDDQSGSSVYVDASELNGPPTEEETVDFPVEIPEAVLERTEPVMSKTAVVRERQSPRRRSVFSHDDDIFGPNWPLTDDRPRSNRPSRPRTPENQPPKPQDVNLVVRSVVETMQNRSTAPAPTPGTTQNPQKRYSAADRMHFDTNSLKALVRRAGELRDTLSDMIRKADQLTQSPVHTPRHERSPDSSPAFTRVFDDPGSSPARPSATRIRRNSNTLIEYPSPDNSSPSNMGRRVQLMTVS